MNAHCKVPADLSQPTEEFLIQNRTQTPIPITDPTRVLPKTHLRFGYGPLKAHVLLRAPGLDPWWVFADKGSCGRSRKEWLRLRDNDEVEIRRVTPTGWEELDEK